MNLRLAPRLLMALLILSFTTLFTSCGEDDLSPNERLQGDWIATSFVVSGTETIGTINSGLTLSFTSNGDESGTFQETTFDLNGNSTSTALTYGVLDNGARIRIGSDTLNMDLTERDLRLDGRLFNLPTVVLANK